jgi:hypothetical protein
MNEYQKEWADFKRRNRAAILFLILGLPAFCFLAFIILKTFHFNANAVGPVMFGSISIWAVIFLILAFRFSRFRCPRCGGRFFSHQEVVIGGVSNCAQCGLKLYSPENKEDKQPNHRLHSIARKLAQREA